MRVLALDIETSPNLAYVWSLWDQNVGLNQLVDTTEMLCFAAKWLGEKPIYFHRGDDMVKRAWSLLDAADVVLHYNGTKFDIPHLNREFLLAGLPPPSPYQQIDLWLAVKKRFKFVSTKLEHVSTALGLGGKVKHEGFDLWKKCMAGDEAAWKRMERYNRQDVRLLEQLYDILQPWIPSHPNRSLYDGTGGCPSCGSNRLQRRGFSYTKVSKFQQWRCMNCGAWTRSSSRESGVALQGVAG